MYLLPICMSSLEKCMFSSLAYFLIGSFIFLELSCRSCLYILIYIWVPPICGHPSKVRKILLLLSSCYKKKPKYHFLPKRILPFFQIRKLQLLEKPKKKKKEEEVLHCPLNILCCTMYHPWHHCITEINHCFIVSPQASGVPKGKKNMLKYKYFLSSFGLAAQ